MTPQEAIERIKIWGNFYRGNSYQRIIKKSEKNKINRLKNVDTYDMAISALEKQIPKKPIEKETDNLWTGMSTRTVSCPNCKKQIVNVWNKADYKPKFCHYCGQALDWSDEE